MKSLQCAGLTLLCVACLSSTGWTQPPKTEAEPGPAALSQEEQGYLQQVNQARSGQPELSQGKVRFRHIEGSPAVVIGYVLDNRNCVAGSVLLDGKVLSIRQASLRILEQAGWAKATPDERKTLVRHFVENVVLGFGEELLDKAPRKFPFEYQKSLWAPLTIETDDSGAFILTGWIREVQGKQTYTIFRRSQFYFAPSGEMQKAQMIAREQAES